jgi:putative ABC transport system ATP-binding protein
VADDRAVIRLDSVTHVYGRSSAAVRALDDVSLDLGDGTFTVVMGPSGSGKTTLLHCAAGMDRPTRGSVWWNGIEVSRLPERELAIRRRDHVGFVFQAFNLIPSMTVSPNVALPSRQQQRVAIARALVSRPQLIFADEPTGALDRRTGEQILDLLRAGVDHEGQTCVMVTHDPVAASYADRVVVLEDGAVVDDLVRPSPPALARRPGA